MKRIMQSLSMLLGLATFTMADASPVFFTAEVGAHAFKWGDSATFSGMPEFGKPRFTLDMGFEWSPLASSGFWLYGGFRYQGLGEVSGSPLDQRFVDGPRVALKWRGKLVP